MPPTPIPLGAFDLLTLIGEGAMGRVWRAMHRQSATPVAVKIIGGERSAATARAFRREVEAVARLDHPGIVRVYDVAAVSQEAAASSRGALSPGNPYLVMELARGGSLEGAIDGLSWSGVRAVIFALLDALAHAHARGVIHRDIKPANVLAAERSPIGDAFILSDFGVAAALREDPDGGGEVSGTPGYMAPEQFVGDMREQGPWTDLYAVGCLAYRLTTGAPPFDSGDLQAMAHAHLFEPPPPLEPRIAIPAGFAAWTLRLLAKAPEDRFELAADAAWALSQLDDSRMLAPSSDGIDRAQIAHATTVAMLTLPWALEPRSSQRASLPPAALPPLPSDWRRPEIAQEPLTGVGLGLFGLRAVQMVDRETERDAMWAALHDVHRDRRPRLIALRGHAGTGKSKLAQWIAERAEELGGGVVIHAHHSRGKGSTDGIIAAIARHLRCQGLARDALMAQLALALGRHGRVDDYLVEALADLLAERSHDSALVEAAASKAVERDHIVVRLLATLSPRRPVVLLLDDVQWGSDALRLARLLMELGPQAPPVLIITTVRDEQSIGAREAAHIAALEADTHSTRLLLDVLAPDDHQRLISQLLGLPGALVDLVAARTEGNPLFAVQLIADWIARGALVAGDGTLHLRPGEGSALPDDIHALCRERVRAVLADRPPADARALQLAALVGRDVDEHQWLEACRRAGVSPSDGLVSALARVGMIERNTNGWSFAHGVIQESLLRLAREAGHARDNHLVLADVLDKPGVESETLVRVALHLLEAGEDGAAVDRLAVAARALERMTELERASDLLRCRTDVMDRLAIAADDPRRAEGDLIAVAIDIARGNLDRADAACARIIKRADVASSPLLHGRAILRQADIAAARGDYLVAAQRYQQALTILHAAGDQRAEFEARHGLGDVCWYRGALAESEVAHSENLSLAERVADDFAIADARWGLGYVALWRDDLPGARTHFEAMLATTSRGEVGKRHAQCLNALGEVARLAGRYDDALKHYSEAMRLLDAYGAVGAAICRLNIAVALVSCDRIDDAAGKLVELRIELERRQLRASLCALLAVGAVVHAARRHLDAFDDALTELGALLTETGKIDGDIAILLGDAARRCAAASLPDRAARAAAMAQQQWLALGRPDRAAKLDPLR